MRKRNYLVKRFAKDVQIENQDLRNEFALTHRAEREMSTMKNLVSPSGTRMKYKYIVQEMKETGNPSTVAFLNDVERMKRMSKKDRDLCLQNRQYPGAVRRLVEEFVPYVILVAYAYKDRIKTLTVLDLINEGILGAYSAFERNERGEVLTKFRVNNLIKRSIRKAVHRDCDQEFAEFILEDYAASDIDSIIYKVK